ncbi:hypothetical protein AGMMS49992_20020 [Clostridia bacterium]|nr:hypothetical protein AGMMS49992_20020 [Clostridia bacterium]
MNYFTPFTDKLALRASNLFAHRQPTIVCLGDSVTHGAFESEPVSIYDPEAMYGERLRHILAGLFPGASPVLINAGVSGDNAPGGLRRIDRDVLSFQPDLVVVCFGLNDSTRHDEGLSDYSAALNGIFDRLKDIPTIFITPCMMCTRVAVSEDSVWRQAAELNSQTQTQGYMDRYMDAARDAARKHNVPVNDEYQHQQSWQSNGVDTDLLLSNHINHPTREIHQMWAHDLANMILSD